MTREQKIEAARPFTEASLGPSWVANPVNKARLDLWLERGIYGRYTRICLFFCVCNAYESTCLDPLGPFVSLSRLIFICFNINSNDI